LLERVEWVEWLLCLSSGICLYFGRILYNDVDGVANRLGVRLLRPDLEVVIYWHFEAAETGKKRRSFRLFFFWRYIGLPG
jgi:hypothetical protein